MTSPPPAIDVDPVAEQQPSRPPAELHLFHQNGIGTGSRCRSARGPLRDKERQRGSRKFGRESMAQAAAVLAAWGLGRVLPMPSVAMPLPALGALLLVLGLSLDLAAVIVMRRSHTNVLPQEIARKSKL